MVYPFIGLYGIVRYKILQKQDARQRECAAESRVEKRDEWVGKYTRSAQTDSAAHHHRHDDVCLQVKETPERLTLLLVAENSLCVLLTHSEKHRAEHETDNHASPTYHRHDADHRLRQTQRVEIHKVGR